jgi:hypothetical protein
MDRMPDLRAEAAHGLESGIEYFVVPPLCPLLGSPQDFSHTNELAESTRT